VRLQGNPIKMSETDPRPRGPAPALGADSVLILKEVLGLSDAEIKKLRETGAI
jgi:crotonobetainyl-CoA:carnitine CoA-transferase CaiB-like acyl-CoA transferase